MPLPTVVISYIASPPQHPRHSLISRTAIRFQINELKCRGIVRTGNAQAGDWAELLVTNAFRRELAPNSDSASPAVIGNELVQLRSSLDDENSQLRSSGHLSSGGWNLGFGLAV